MKKGDLRKRNIMNTAEELFCRYGYEQTTVQDIIDQLNLSKGSFYHHFVSKEALLEAICRNRALYIYESAEKAAAKADSKIEKIDRFLSGMVPFQDEKLPFILMLLPVFVLPEGRKVREAYCDALFSYFYTPVCHQIKSGYLENEFFIPDPENAAKISLFLVNRFWVQIAEMIIVAENQHVEPDVSEFLRLSDSYRICIERFLFLPYGSIKLIDFPALKYLTDQIHNHWI